MCAGLGCRWHIGRLLRTPPNATRTSARPDAGRMLVKVSALFTMGLKDADAVEICAAEAAMEAAL